MRACIQSYESTYEVRLMLHTREPMCKPSTMHTQPLPKHAQAINHRNQSLLRACAAVQVIAHPACVRACAAIRGELNACMHSKLREYLRSAIDAAHNGANMQAIHMHTQPLPKHARAINHTNPPACMLLRCKYVRTSTHVFRGSNVIIEVHRRTTYVRLHPCMAAAVQI